MKSRASETIDDLIDRVAANMTHVSPNDGCGDRVLARLDEQPLHRWTWMPAAAVAVLLVSAIVVSMPEKTERERLVTAVSSPAAEPSPPAVNPTVAPAASRGAVASPARAVGTRRTGVERGSVPPSAIPALPTPPVLALDGLTVDALTVPAVEIGHIEMPSLSIDELTSPPDSKELP